MTAIAFAFAVVSCITAIAIYVTTRPPKPMTDDELLARVRRTLAGCARRADPVTLRTLSSAIDSLEHWRRIEIERMRVQPPTDEQLLEEMETH